MRNAAKGGDTCELTLAGAVEEKRQSRERDCAEQGENTTTWENTIPARTPVSGAGCRPHASCARLALRACVSQIEGQEN